MKTRRAGGVGSVSLVLIFATLCLGIFAVLSLSDSVSQKRTADLLAEAAANYYAADREASQIYAAAADCLRRGETLPATLLGVALDVRQDTDGTHIQYSCGIDDSQLLAVELLCSDNAVTIIKWAKCARTQWVGDDAIPVLQ